MGVKYDVAGMKKMISDDRYLIVEVGENYHTNAAGAGAAGAAGATRAAGGAGAGATGAARAAGGGAGADAAAGHDASATNHVEKGSEESTLKGDKSKVGSTCVKDAECVSNTCDISAMNEGTCGRAESHDDEKKDERIKVVGDECDIESECLSGKCAERETKKVCVASTDVEEEGSTRSQLHSNKDTFHLRR